MKNKVDSLTLSKIVFFIPAFHINAHKESCLVKYHPRNVPSMGDIDGESVERMWSQLASYSCTTRNMSAGNRREQLADAIQEIRTQTVCRLAKYLASKMRKSQRILNIIREQTPDTSATTSGIVFL
jgi:hypothetical protein